MGIISRCGDVFRSYANAIVWKVSNPQKMLRLMIQDMEDTLVKVRASAVRTIADRKDLERRIDNLKDEAASWQDKAEVAVMKSRDDLATAALQSKARCLQMVQGLEKQLAAIASSLNQQSDDLERLQARLQDAKLRERSFGALHKSAKSRLKLRRKLFDHRLNDALARFEQLESHLDEIEGQVESYDLGRNRELAGNLSALAIEASTASELSDLKMRLGNRVIASSVV
jgi:phage shock protein A